MAKGCALSTGYLPRGGGGGGGLPRNSVDRILDRPDMTSAVDCGRKTSTEKKKKKQQRKKSLYLCLNRVSHQYIFVVLQYLFASNNSYFQTHVFKHQSHFTTYILI